MQLEHRPLVSSFAGMHLIFLRRQCPLYLVSTDWEEAKEVVLTTCNGSAVISKFVPLLVGCAQRPMLATQVADVRRGHGSSVGHVSPVAAWCGRRAWCVIVGSRNDLHHVGHLHVSRPTHYVIRVKAVLHSKCRKASVEIGTCSGQYCTGTCCATK